jgi:hypothetical protein
MPSSLPIPIAAPLVLSDEGQQGSQQPRHIDVSAGSAYTAVGHRSPLSGSGRFPCPSNLACGP